MFVSTNRSRPVAPSKYLGRGFSFKLRHNKPKTISRLFFILQPPWSFLDFRDNYWKVSRATLQEEFYNSRAEVGPCNPTLRGWMEFSSSKRCLGLVNRRRLTPAVASASKPCFATSTNPNYPLLPILSTPTQYSTYLYQHENGVW